MLRFANSSDYLVETPADLPRLKGSCLILDLETTSGNKDLMSLNPFRNCKIAGIAVTHDKLKESFYVPVGHNAPYNDRNLPREAVVAWVKDLFQDHESWLNQNVKYDAHVMFNDFGLDFPGRLICTLNARARLHNSERIYTGGYGLEVLAEQILDKDIRSFEKALDPYRAHSKDYGDIDPLALGPYACVDVKTVQELEEFFLRELPPELQEIIDLEIRTTKALMKMERIGMRVKKSNVALEKLKCIIRIREIESLVFDKLKKWVNFKSPKDMEDVICNIFGLPVVAYTNEDDDSKDSNPSFSKDALREYKSLVGDHLWFIEAAEEARELGTFESLFLDTYIAENIEGILHPTYNQIVRTGRMSCSRPNMQQLSTRAKDLILPNEEGWGLIRFDYSQIEQRIICNYLGDPAIIEAFQENPDMDSYLALAQKAKCERDVAKVISLGVSYGMGVKKLIKWLSSIKTIVSVVTAACEKELIYKRLETKHARITYVQAKLERHCRQLYSNFHKGMPKLKPMSKAAESVCARRGYVKTMTGRRRHLAKEYSRKAFNAASQGSAADLIKYKVCEFVELLEPFNVHLIAQVHDELVFTGPKEIVFDPRFFRDVADIMEQNPLDMAIPIRVSGGYSEESWADASRKPKDPLFDPTRNELKLPLEARGTGENFSWLN